MRLETNRLFIRRLNESDWQEMKNIFIDFNNSKYVVYDMPLPTEDEETRALTKSFADSNLFFVVFLKESNDMIGYVCFHKDGDKYDLGYCFHSAYHLNGYAYESTIALIKYLTDEYGAIGFTAGTAIDNVPSCRLLKKLGFVCVSTETVSFDNAFSFQGGNFERSANVITIRNATVEDAKHLLEIYNYYVENTAITFEYKTLSLVEFERRMEQTMRRYPYLVILNNGHIEGYAYAGPFIGRAAYDWSCEITVYLDPKAQKLGMGRAIYESLEKKLKNMGILNLYACIAYPKKDDEYLTTNSAEFHAHLGFVKIGEFHKCGYKFGRWYNMIWMEKIIGRHGDKPSPIMII